ncbi:MAG TPA: SDR family oxidoreductase [Burkholderiales bacterium]|nr:SDR family oxidoreductase [Burkholderiales bacterium]
MAYSEHSEVVVITGASAGVGRATAQAFARRGAHIGLLARDADRLDAACREVRALGGKALPLSADVADMDAVERSANEVESTFGPIDIWVNNAMVTLFAPFREIDAKEFRRVTEVTYLGAVHGTMAALSRMLLRDRGCIVQVGSALAKRSIPLQSAYCGAKHAIIGFTDSLRCELIHEHSNVHLSVVHLPSVNTPQFGWARNLLRRKPQPVPPIFQPEVAARAIVWAAHHHRRDVLVGGSTVKAEWVQKFFPRALDYYLGRTACEAQQSAAADDPGRSGNLWQPGSGDPGAHGRFDRDARDHSTVLWLTRNRNRIALAGLGTAALVCMMRKERR